MARQICAFLVLLLVLYLDLLNTYAMVVAKPGSTRSDVIRKRSNFARTFPKLAYRDPLPYTTSTSTELSRPLRSKDYILGIGSIKTKSAATTLVKKADSPLAYRSVLDQGKSSQTAYVVQSSNLRRPTSLGYSSSRFMTTSSISSKPSTHVSKISTFTSTPPSRAPMRSRTSTATATPNSVSVYSRAHESSLSFATGTYLSALTTLPPATPSVTALAATDQQNISSIPTTRPSQSQSQASSRAEMLFLSRPTALIDTTASESQTSLVLPFNLSLYRETSRTITVTTNGVYASATHRISSLTL